MVAMIYFVLSFAASRLVRWLERHLTPAYLRRQGRRVSALVADPVAAE